MNLTFGENYWDAPRLKQEFLKFLLEIFGLDLSLWDRMGYWDHNYRPFSYFDGKRLVSSLCVYSMDMMVMGQRRQVAQISAVGTLPEYRRQGLNYELTQKALDWAGKSHDFFFLFGDREAHPFYAKCGFRRVIEHKECIGVHGKPCRAGAKKMDVTKKEHLEQIYRLASERAPVSDLLGVYNPKLFMFWCLYYLKDNIYCVPDLEALVLYERKGGLVTVFDVVGRNVPPFAQLYPYISSENDESVEFMFMADKLSLGATSNPAPIETNGTHLTGDFPLRGREFIFPQTSHA